MTLKKPGDPFTSMVEAVKNMDMNLPKVTVLPHAAPDLGGLVAAQAAAADARAGLAHTMYDALASQVTTFQDSLASDEEVGAVLASFGAEIRISVRTIGFRNPHLMVFVGEAPDGKTVELLQHTSQVNLLLVRMKVTDRKPHRIGFKTEDVKP